MISVPIAILVAVGTLLLIGSFIGLYLFTRKRLLADPDLVAFVERVEDARAAQDEAEQDSLG